MVCLLLLSPCSHHRGLLQDPFRLFSHLELFQCFPFRIETQLLLDPMDPAWLVHPLHLLFWAATILAS